MNSIVSEPRAERECPDEPQAGLGSSEFAELYTEHSRAIYYLCLRLLSDPDKAEDATHDVFLKAFRKMNQFRGESSWRTWLYRIAINHCHNLHAAWHDRHMLTNADEAHLGNHAGPDRFAVAGAGDQGTGRAHSEDARWTAPEYRLLLLLVADEQLSYEQVGALTEQSADAVRGKLHRARKAFTVLFQQTA